MIYPGTNYTAPIAINDAGTIVGDTQEGVDNVGFELLASGGGTLIAIAPDVRNYTLVNGISDSGEVIGYTQSGINFSFHKAKYIKYKRVKIPNVHYPVVAGIDPGGTSLVGHYQRSPGVAVGFIYQNNVFTTLEFPGAKGTGASGINGAGEVVGSFTDASGNGHGFIWTSPADAAKK